MAPACRMSFSREQRTGKPLGYAYVAITLDNSDHQLAIDYDEVTVHETGLPFRGE